MSFYRQPLRASRRRVPGLRGRGGAARWRSRSSHKLSEGQITQVTEALREVLADARSSVA